MQRRRFASVRLLLAAALLWVASLASLFSSFVPPLGGIRKSKGTLEAPRRLILTASSSLITPVRSAMAMPEMEIQSRRMEEMREAQLYLNKCGIPAGLPELSVVWGGKGTAIHGKRSQFKKTKDTFLQNAPSISFDPALGRCTLVMVDPDAPAPKDDGETPGALSPILHWLATDCTGGKVDGGLVPYAGPAPPFGTHRYIEVLFQQTGDVKLLGSEQTRIRWDFPAFVQANAKSLTPVAVNCFYCASQ
eukprot:TRINITY_DN39618_c0_g1_i1.p1 TRINITY_DN39618_c0_g1~~TRINITY_DN39618_c0_g1_i1.p1  ORF type:complete len:248 (+),score=28.97 TRINITY_DN39618_c0_g1_i1:61-804(+)